MHEGVQDLYETHWSYSWSDLPPEVESEVEQAFEHIQRAHAMLEDRE